MLPDVAEELSRYHRLTHEYADESAKLRSVLRRIERLSADPAVKRECEDALLAVEGPLVRSNQNASWRRHTPGQAALPL